MLAEAVFLLLLWLVYSVFRIKRLKNKSDGKVIVKEVTKEVTKEVKPDVEIPTYLTFLNQALLATELRLEEEQEEKEDAPEEEDSFDLGGSYENPLELRLAFIRSEINAIEASGEDGGAYWKSQEQSLKDILGSIPTVETGAQEPQSASEESSAEAEESGSSGDDSLLKAELGNARQQIESLEQYKTLFYGLAGKLKDTSEAARPVPEQLESVKAQLEDTSQIDVLTNSYEQEYNNLKSLLDNIGDGELDEISRDKLKKMLDMRTQRPKEKVVYVDKAEHKVRHEVDKIKEASAQQQGIITELQGMLEMSEDEGMKGEFMSRVNALEAALSESKMCIDVLESENQSRQEQLEDLLLTLDDLTAKAERLEEIESGAGGVVQEDIDEEIDPDDLLAQVQQDEDKGTPVGSNDPTDEMVELERERVELRRKLEVVEEEKKEIAEQLQEQQQKVIELEDKISKFSRETGDVMNAVVTLEDENDRLMEEVDQIRHEKEELEDQIKHSSEEGGLPSEADQGQQDVDPDDIDALIAGANDIFDQVAEEEAEEQVESAGMGEEEFKQVSQQISNEIDTEVEELERQNSDLNEELQQSKTLLESKQGELEKAIEEFKVKEQEFESLTQQLDEKEGVLQEKQKELEERQEELEQAQSELKAIKEEVEEKDALYERLKKEFAEMEQALQEKM